MRSLSRLVWVFIAAAALSCGAAPPADTSCQTSCDCKQTSAAQSCLGEWVCNAQNTCAYACKGACALGAPYTCRDGEDCNGSICSEKIACH